MFDVVEVQALVHQLRLRLDLPALAEREGLADLQRGAQAAALALGAQSGLRLDFVAVAPGLQHGIGVEAAVVAVGGVAAQVLAAQVVAADGQVGDAAGEALDLELAVELAGVEAGAPVGGGPQVGAGLHAAQAAIALRADGAALLDVAAGAEDAAPGAALAG